jgi:hypothetical protein
VVVPGWQGQGERAAGGETDKVVEQLTARCGERASCRFRLARACRAGRAFARSSARWAAPSKTIIGDGYRFNGFGAGGPRA